MPNPVEEYCNAKSNHIVDLLVVKNPQFIKLYYATISLETFKAIADKIGKIHHTEFEQLVQNNNIPLQHLLQLCDNYQKQEFLCDSPRLTLELILNNPTQKWIWEKVTANNAITIYDIDEHSHLPWMWQHVHFKPNITEKFIEKHITKNLYFAQIFKKSMVSLKFIANHTDKLFGCHLTNGDIQDIIRREQKTFAEWNMRNISLVFIMDFYQTKGISTKSPKYFALSNDYIIACVAKY